MASGTSVFSLVIHGVLQGILFGGAILMTYVYVRSRTRLHLTVLLFTVACILYMLNEGMILVSYFTNNPVMGRQFHRLQAVSLLFFILIIPPFIAVTVELPRVFRRINRLIFIFAAAFTAFMVIIAFAFPDLFVSVQRPFRAAFASNMRWAEVRGLTGPLYPLRDVVLFTFVLYMLVCFIFTIIRGRGGRYVILPILGVMCVMFTGILDYLFLYTSFGRAPLLRYLSSFTDLGITTFIVMSLISVVRRYEDESREIENVRKFDSLGTLAGGIAHDFNNLLTAVMGYISLVRDDIPADAKDRGYLNEAAAAALRAQQLSRELLSLTRGVVLTQEAFSPGALLGELKYLLPPDSKIHMDIAISPHLKNVFGDKAQISRVLENMVLNAIQAMPGGGRLQLSAFNEELAPYNTPGLVRGGYVAIVIRDSGHGIRRADQARLFDPSYSTRGKGHGLGLAIAHRIITLHGGAVRVDSRPGGGTAFTLYLPATDAPPSPSAADEPSRRKLAGRVLYLEDEPVVAAVGRKMLASLGLAADTCGTGEEAVAAFRKAREEKHPYGFVLLDILIARGMGGIETVRELRRLDPGVKTAATSGYTGDDLPSRYRAYGFDAFLPKPFQLDDIRNLAESLLSDQ